MLVEDGAEPRRQAASHHAHAQQLLHEEWIAFAHGEETLGTRRRACGCPRADLLGREARQGQQLCLAPNLGEHRAGFWIRKQVRLAKVRREAELLPLARLTA